MQEQHRAFGVERVDERLQLETVTIVRDAPVLECRAALNVERAQPRVMMIPSVPVIPPAMMMLLRRSAKS